MARFWQMHDLSQSLWSVAALLSGADPQLWSIVRLSILVSAMATVLAALLAFPLAAWIAMTPFAGRGALIASLNALMGLPPVVVGLLVYLMLSRAGPFGWLGIIFTPSAMVLAQCALVMPLMTALARQTFEDALHEYDAYLRSLQASKVQRVATLIRETRFSLLTVLLAGFGRAAAEVGAVMIVGGNIEGVTRVMTTTIALETSKGDLSLALGLGLVLVLVVLVVNSAAYAVRIYSARRYG